MSPLHAVPSRLRALVAAVSAVLLLLLAGYMRIAIAKLDFGTKFVVFFACMLLLLAVLLAVGGGKSRAAHACLLLSQVGEMLLFVFLASFAAVQMLILAGARSDVPSSDGGAKYVVVMGAGLRGDVPTRVLALRLEAARVYLEEHPDSVAILTGGQGSGETVAESSAMKTYLEERGIAEERLLEEPEARSTVENVRFSAALMDAGGQGQTVAAVSNYFHMYRVRRLFEAEGIDAVAVGAPVPNPGVAVSMHIREYFSIWNMWLGNPMTAEVQ